MGSAKGSGDGGKYEERKTGKDHGTFSGPDALLYDFIPAADQAGVAVVHTDRPSNMVITHQVRASGKVVQNQETAVVTEPNQRVTAIYVNEGDRVEKGDLFLKLI